MLNTSGKDLHIAMKLTTGILLIFVLFASCGQNQVKTNESTIKKLKEFKNNEKFLGDKKRGYTGVADPILKRVLTEKINLAADDFITLAEKGNSSDKDYQNVIKKGLERFSGIYLDTEYQEQICSYYEDLMDIVGLESSGGHLNNFIYGFDPAKKQ